VLDELNKAIQEYQIKWDALVAGRKNKEFFESLKPTAVGWKTVDRDEYDNLVAELHDQADLAIEVWMNGRWIAKIHLKDAKLANGAEIVKIMQRRPGSNDVVGLDHVDFYGPDPAQIEAVLKQETNLQWTHESNDVVAGYEWLSIWFADTEAKLKHDPILDIVRTELEELNNKILGI
jgi:hypothetical protein